MEADTGTVLKTYPLGENGLIVVWSTAGHGILRTSARGAQKPGGPFSGRLDLFYSCELGFNPSRQGDLHPLAHAALLKPRLGLRKNLATLKLAGYMAHLTLATVEHGTPIPEFYELLDRALDYLCEHEGTMPILSHFEKRLAEEHGLYEPGTVPIAALAGHFPHLPRERDDLLALLSRR